MWPPLYGGGYAAALAQVMAVYYSAAVLLHYVVPALLPTRSVQKGVPRRGQVSSEAFNSLGPLLIKAAVLTAVEKMHGAGWGLLYTGRPSGAAALCYLAATVVALDLLHDTWFYWTHRLLHWGPVYARVHALHHRSSVPTAFTGYSFHPAEAALVFANEVLVCFLFPIHLGLHRAYHLFTTVIHNGGHAGYEIAPFIPSLEAVLGLALRCVGGAGAGGGGAPWAALNTVRHHDMHHRFPTAHFSLYMTHWDRLMGTEHPAYRGAVDAHFGGSGAAAAAAAAAGGAGMAAAAAGGGG